jgi:hypothetical protein
LAFRAVAGFIYRTAGFASLLPWNIRADFSLQQHKHIRFWSELQSFESLEGSAVAYNTHQIDPIPNGSLLFKSYSPTLRTANLGIGYLISKEWEAVAGGFFTATGENAAKGWGAGLGFTWRPYQVPEIKYVEYRKRQIERIKSEPRNSRREVVRYGLSSTVVKVSAQGNFLKIFYGAKDRIRVDDTFYVYVPPDTMNSQARRPVAFASVVQVQPEAAFLHVDERYVDGIAIQDGFEVRQVFFEAED